MKALSLISLILLINIQLISQNKVLVKELDIKKFNTLEDLYQCGENDENLFFVYSEFSSFSNETGAFSKHSRYRYDNRDKTAFYKLDKETLELEFIIEINSKEIYQTNEGKNFATEFVQIVNNTILVFYSYQNNNTKKTCLSYVQFDFNGKLIANNDVDCSTVIKKKGAQPFSFQVKNKEIFISVFNPIKFDGEFSKHRISTKGQLTILTQKLNIGSNYTILQETSLSNEETLLLTQQTDDSSKYVFEIILINNGNEDIHEKVIFENKNIVDIKVTKSNNEIFLFGSYKEIINKKEKGWVSYLHNIDSKNSFQKTGIYSDSITNGCHKSNIIGIQDIFSVDNLFIPICECTNTSNGIGPMPIYISNAPAHMGHTGVMGPGTSVSSIGPSGGGSVESSTIIYALNFSSKADLTNFSVHREKNMEAGIPIQRKNSVQVYYLDLNKKEALPPYHVGGTEKMTFYHINLICSTITNSDTNREVIATLEKGVTDTKRHYKDSNGNLYLTRTKGNKLSFIKIYE